MAEHRLLSYSLARAQPAFLEPQTACPQTTCPRMVPPTVGWALLINHQPKQYLPSWQQANLIQAILQLRFPLLVHDFRSCPTDNKN